MTRSSGTLALMTVGLGAIAFHCKPQGDVCTPFPPPVVTTGAACTPLPPLTRLQDFGTGEAGGGDTPGMLIVDDNSIYYTAAAPGAPTPTLYRAPKTGGSAQVIDDDVTGPLAFDGAFLVYTRMTAQSQSGGYASASPNVIRLGDRCSMAALPNAGSVTSVFGPTVDGAGGISWTGISSSPSDPVWILHFDPTSNTTSEIQAIANDAGFVVGDADHLYWTEPTSTLTTSPMLQSTSTTAIKTIPSTGGTATTLATLPGYLAIATLDDDSLYLVTSMDAPPSFTNLPSAPAAGLTRVRKTDGSIINTIATPTYASGFVAHDTNVYFIGAVINDGYSAGYYGSTVQRAPKSGGPSEVLADLENGEGEVLGIAVDSCNVYLAANAPNAANPLIADNGIWGQALPPVTSTVDSADASAPDAADASTSADGSTSCASGAALAVAPCDTRP